MRGLETSDYDDLSNRELLEELAARDPEKYPIAKRARVALEEITDD